MGLKFTGESLRNFQICSRHFTPDSYRDPNTYKLRADAVPTLFSMSQFLVSIPVCISRDTGDGKSLEISSAVVTGTKGYFYIIPFHIVAHTGFQNK